MVKYTASMKVYLLVLLLVVWVEQAVVDAANVGGNCTLPIVQHGFFVHLNPGGQNIIQHNRIAYISCQEGYSLDGPPEIICRHGSWSTDIPVCKPKECSMVSVPNGIITSNSSSTEPISHKSYIYINCSQGYVLEGISSLFCNFGKWSSDIPSCVPMPCETTQVRNGILIHEGGIVRTSMKIRHQDSVMVSCRTGYILSSQFSQVSCLLGKWSHPFPTCMPEPCTPHKVLNGRVLYSGRDVSSDTEVQDSHTATIVCDPDYILHGDSGLTCHKGQWSADFPSCLPKFCSSELVLQGQVIYNGQVLQDITKVQHRSSVYINCKAGYVNVGSTKVTCTYGHWSNYFPTCLPKSCHAQTVLHGTVKYLEHQLTNVCSTLSGGLVSHSHAVSVECLPGFLLEGTDILSCKFGNWSDAFPKCQPASCRVEGVENGGTVDEEEMEVVVAAHGKEVTVVCNDGYRLPRDRPLDKIKCYYGQWTYSFPACVPENCSANSVLNGQVVYNNSVVDFNVLNPRPLQVPHKQHVQINCMPGFNMTERSRIMCVSGKWSHQFPTCYPNSCQANPVENGVTRVVEENSLLRDWGQLVSHGLSVNISCKVGHELSGSDHLKCLYGNWTGDFPTCTPKSCLVKKVKNGQESYHDDTITSFVKHNMFVHISCDDGYSLVGASKIKCSEGYWCSALPTCEPKQCQVNEVPNSSIKVNGKKLVVYDKPAAHLSIAVVTCRRGYNLNGIPRVQCLFGKWSSEFPTCEGLVCEAPSISNGRLKDVSTNEIVPAGTTIEANVSLTVECDTDYTLQGEPGVTQCDMAKWTNVFPTCEKNIYCEKFKGDFEMLVTYSGPLSKGAIAKFECRNVYCFKTNDEIAVCGSDGKWQIGDVPKCDCGS
ncbi:sushi, von Willebrand factor type A, EGF and pentraxin domain-containing protein 1-like [Argonauta hians]